jgi:hypothetical protein
MLVMRSPKLNPALLAFLVFLIVLFAALAFYLSQVNDAYRNLDFFTFWLGSRMTLHGENVYQPELWVANHGLYQSTWIENLFYVYPLSTALFLLPLGWLELPLASTLWLFTGFLSITVGVLLLLSEWHTPRWQSYGFPIILASFCFRPVFLNFTVGQFDALLFLFLSLAIFFYERGRIPLAGFFLALLSLKPNLGLPLIALFGLFLLFRRAWKPFFWLAGFTLGIQLIPFLISLQWFVDYLHVLLHKSEDNNLFPNLHGLAGVITGNDPALTLPLWGILSILVIGVVVGFLFKYRSQLSIKMGIALVTLTTLLITPYLRAYDLLFVLLPMLMITEVVEQKKHSFWLTNLAYFNWSLLAFGLLFLAVKLQHDIFSVGLPLLALLLLLALAHSERTAALSRDSLKADP